MSEASPGGGSGPGDGSAPARGESPSSAAGGVPVRGPRPAPPPPRDRRVPAPHLEWGRSADSADSAASARSLWREPVRAAIGIACLVVLVAIIQPMATGSTPFDGPATEDALSGVGDGTLLVFACAAMAVVTFWRPVTESEHLLPNVLPLLVGIVATFEFGLIVQGARFAIDDWTARGGSGALTAWVYVLGAAVVVILAGGAILSWQARRRARTRTGPSA